MNETNTIETLNAHELIAMALAITMHNVELAQQLLSLLAVTCLQQWLGHPPSSSCLLLG